MNTTLEELQASTWIAVSRSMTDALGATVTLTAESLAEPTLEEAALGVAAPGAAATFRFAASTRSAVVLHLDQDALAAIEASDPAAAASALEAACQGACIGLGLSLPKPLSPAGFAVSPPLEQLPAGFDAEGGAVWFLGTVTTDRGAGKAVLLLSPAAVAVVTGAEVEEEPAPAASGESPNLGLLLNVPLELSVELGRVKIPVRSVVELGPGSIVEIEKAAGEPVDVLLNGKLVARGEVVVIDDNFGVRITEILRPSGANQEAA
jgi:flagellar motor switch protein FliN/FliY